MYTRPLYFCPEGYCVPVALSTRWDHRRSAYERRNSTGSPRHSTPYVVARQRRFVFVCVAFLNHSQSTLLTKSCLHLRPFSTSEVSRTCFPPPSAPFLTKSYAHLTYSCYHSVRARMVGVGDSEQCFFFLLLKINIVS